MKKIILVLMLLLFSGTARADYNQVWPFSRGGTGQTTQQLAIDALAAVTTSGYYLRGNGSHVVMSAIQAGDVPTLNQNTSGSAASLSGALSANQLLGSLTAVAPTGLSVPSCSTAASALQWTSGTGFACNTAIAASTATTQASSDNSTSIATTAFVINAKTHTIGFSATYPTTGQQCCYYTMPVSGTITGWSMATDTGVATVQTWKVASGTASPTVSNSISAAGVSLVTGTLLESTTLSDFTTTTVTAGDTFAFNVSALSGSPTKLTFQLKILVN